MDQEKIYKFIEFSGDYSKLKSMGFSFQKLYAGNYMQWAHSDSEFGSSTRIWKKGSEVTIDRLTNYEGFFLEALLKARVEKIPLKMLTENAITYIKNPETKEIFFDEESIQEARRQRKLTDEFYSKDRDENEEPPEETMISDFIKIKDIEMILKLVDLGWAKVKTIK